MSAFYHSRYNTIQYHSNPYCTETFTSNLLIGQLITCHLGQKNVYIEQSCNRNFHKRQKQTESKMKGLLYLDWMGSIFEGKNIDM